MRGDVFHLLHEGRIKLDCNMFEHATPKLINLLSHLVQTHGWHAAEVIPRIGIHEKVSAALGEVDVLQRAERVPVRRATGVSPPVASQDLPRLGARVPESAVPRVAGVVRLQGPVGLPRLASIPLGRSKVGRRARSAA